MSPSSRRRHPWTARAVSWSSSLGLLLLPGLWGCAGGATAGTFASTGPTGTLALRGFYLFEGRLSGEHVYRTRREHFTREVRGTVEFLPDRIRMGGCDLGPREFRVTDGGRGVTFVCGDTQFRFGEGWGGATVPVIEEWEQRGECAFWEILPNGKRGRCLEYRWVVRQRRTWKSTMLTVREPG